MTLIIINLSLYLYFVDLTKTLYQFAEVKRLIEAGADVNAQDSEEWPALMIASWGGHMEIVKLLIEKGADVNAKSEYGVTALELATREHHKEIVRLLREAGAREK